MEACSQVYSLVFHSNISSDNEEYLPIYLLWTNLLIAAILISSSHVLILC